MKRTLATVCGFRWRTSSMFTLPRIYAEAEEILKSDTVHVMLTDLRLGGESGMDLITQTLARPKPPTCILMTAYGSVDVAVEAMKKGAYDYVSKTAQHRRAGNRHQTCNTQPQC